MIIEQLIFVVIAFAIFVYMFLKMMKKSDISYIIILVLEALGITINFLEVLFTIKLNIFLVILKYILSLIIPIVAILIEKNGNSLAEVFNISLVKILMKFDNNKTAKKILLELASKYPDNHDAHSLLAQIYETEGGMRKAIDEYVQAVDLNKKDYDSYYRVAYLLKCLDRKDDAAQMLSSLLSKKPDYYEATLLLGDIFISNEMYKEAALVYQNALKFNPTSYEINYSLGIVYTMLNDFQNAKVCYEKAAQINALSYNSKYSLAQIALIYKNIDAAERMFLEVIESDEELSADAYYELSKINLIKGNKDMAIKYANVATEINPKIGEKIKSDPVFIPVLSKISIPFNIEGKEKDEENKSNIKKNNKLNEKELKAKEHLEEMSSLTRNLSYDDIKLFKRYRGDKVQRKKEEKDKDIEKEKQE